MSSQTTEFTRKLRAAVKAKLEEFGLDVDEELPDYVMIMVGNKKDKSRMKADLKLFLGENTSAFVDWLFGFFQKVKSVTSVSTSETLTINVNNKLSDNAKKKDDNQLSDHSHKPRHDGMDHKKNEKAKTKNEEERTKSSLTDTKVSESKHKKLLESTTNNDSKKSSANKTNSSQKNLETDQLVKSSKKNEIKKKKVVYNDESREADDTETKKNILHDNKEKSKTKTLQNQSKKLKEEKANNLAKPNKVNEKNLLIDKSNLSKQSENFETIDTQTTQTKLSLKQMKTTTNDNDGGIELDDLEDDFDNDLATKTVHSKVVVQSNIEPPPPKVSSKVVVLRKINESVSQQNRGMSSLFKKAISEAASVSAGYGGGNIQSIKNIKQKKISLEKIRPNMHLDYENENKLMRQKSRDEYSSNKKLLERIIVTVNSNSIENSNDDMKKRLKISLIPDSNVADNNDINYDLKNKKSKILIKNNIIEAATNNINQSLVTTKRQLTTSNEDDSLQKPNEESKQKRKRIVYELDDEKNVIKKNTVIKKSNIRPIISMQKKDIDNKYKDGIELDHLITLLKKKRNGNHFTKLLKNEGVTPKMMRLVKEALDEAKITEEYDPTDEGGNLFEMDEKSNSQKKLNSNLNVEKKGEADAVTSQWDGQINLEISSSDDEAEIDAVLATAQAVREATQQIEKCESLPPTAVLSRPNMLKSAGVSEHSFASLGYNPAQYQTSFVPPVRMENGNNKISERCRFWPDCRNEDVCPFHHPANPCSTFPNCWYGDKCLFIHPPCKFGQNCIKQKCSYTHYKIPIATGTTNNGGAVSQCTTSISQSTTSTSPISTNATVTSSTTTTNTSVVMSTLASSTTTNSSTVTPTIPLSTTSTTSASTATTVNVACRYGGRCQNLKCLFKHPALCRFGVHCLNKSCYFLHRKTAVSTSLSKVYNVPTQQSTSAVTP